MRSMPNPFTENVKLKSTLRKWKKFILATENLDYHTHMYVHMHIYFLLYYVTILNIYNRLLLVWNWRNQKKSSNNRVWILTRLQYIKRRFYEFQINRNVFNIFYCELFYTCTYNKRNFIFFPWTKDFNVLLCNKLSVAIRKK